MKGRKSGYSVSSGLGTGYVTMVMVFVTICLSTLAALSFSAAGSENRFGEKSRESMAAYYEAENKANRILMEMDEKAYNAHNGGIFGTFGDTAAQAENVTAADDPEGCLLKWDIGISDKLVLKCEVLFYRDPAAHGNERYKVNVWNVSEVG